MLRRLDRSRTEELFAPSALVTARCENKGRSVSPRGLTIWGDSEMRIHIPFAFAIVVTSLAGDPVLAQVPAPELELCRSTGLLALRERNAAITDVTFDVDSMTVAKSNTKVEDTPIKTIVIGDAYLEKGKKDTRRTFLCLVGEKGKVLLTFFTDR